MTGVRYREDTGLEGKCERCREWWPIDGEFWRLEQGLRRCRACISDLQRKYDRNRAKKQVTPEEAARRRLRDNERKRRARYDAKRREAILARERVNQREYYYRNRERVLAGMRAAYVEKIGREPRPGVGRPRLSFEEAA